MWSFLRWSITAFKNDLNKGMRQQDDGRIILKK